MVGDWGRVREGERGLGLVDMEGWKEGRKGERVGNEGILTAS